MSAGALVKEAFDLPAVPRRPLPNTPALHAFRTQLRGASREAVRVRDVSLWVIVIGLGLAGIGIAVLRLEFVWVGLLALIASGFVIGFSAIALYKANERVQDAARQLERHSLRERN